eukprot:1728593-Pleurochrysis_carterae.AAC.2
MELHQVFPSGKKAFGLRISGDASPMKGNCCPPWRLPEGERSNLLFRVIWSKLAQHLLGMLGCIICICTWPHA